MTALARTFRVFAPDGTQAYNAWLVPFDPEKLHEASRTWPRDERSTVDFLLNVFAPADWPFDLHDALGTWGQDDRESFAAWAARPWWP